MAEIADLELAQEFATELAHAYSVFPAITDVDAKRAIESAETFVAALREFLEARLKDRAV